MKEEEEKFKEFYNSVKKVDKPRKHKVSGSYGVYHAYKWIRKNSWLNIPRPLTEHEFYSIIRTVNKYFAENIIEGEDVNFPCRMGKLELLKSPTRVDFKDGKLVTNLPIDWLSTLKLWYEDKEAFDNKQLVRSTTKELFKVNYNVYDANYNNKCFYSWNLNRDIKVRLKQQIHNNNVDAYLKYKQYDKLYKHKTNSR